MRVAVLGATGLVGREMVATLEQRAFPVDELIPLASERSAGKKISFGGREWTVRAVSAEAFENVDIAIFSAGGDASRKWAPIAASKGAVVIDNSSAWRMDPQVPLVVPEINPEEAKKNSGIIANPNCSTIHAVTAINSLHRAAGLKRLLVVTQQSVSGSGIAAVRELYDEAAAVLDGDLDKADGLARKYPYRIAFNSLPHVGSFDDGGYTDEEWKMVNESKKIMGLTDVKIACTCTRVSVERCHSLAITAQFSRDITPDEARDILADAPGVVLQDDPFNNVYPLAIRAAGTDPVYVGRIRKSLALDQALDLWVVSDNIRKGAALNAVQIAELLI